MNAVCFVEATGQCVVDTDFIINDNGCQLKLSINVNIVDIFCLG